MPGQPPVHLLLAAQEAGGKGGFGGFDLLLPIILFAIVYFVAIRPAAQERKRQHELIQSLKRGDEIITQQGLFGTISDIQDKTLTLEVARNVKVKMLRTAVKSRAPSAADEKSDKSDKSDKDAKKGGS